MKRILLTPLVVVLLLGADTPKDDSIVVEVRKALDSLNQAFEKGDVKAVERLMTADHLAITPYYGKPLTRAEQMKTFPEMKLTTYSPGKMQLTVLNKGAVLVTYPLTLKGTYKGKSVPVMNQASAVWVQRDGKWLEAFYQETPVADR